MMIDDYCVLKKDCGENGFLTREGKCYSCSDTSSSVTTVEQCAKCGNVRRMERYSNGGGVIYICNLNNCGENSFLDEYGGCHSCSTTQTVYTTVEECAKCDETETPRVMIGLACRLKKDCGEGKFQGERGSCYLCSSANSITSNPEECAKCGDLRMMIDSSCVLKKDCDENSFLGQDDQCHPCESDAPYITSETQCDRCGGNRKMIKKYCVLDRKCPENSFLAADGQCYPCSATISYETTDEEYAKCGTMRSMTNTNFTTECALNKGCSENEFRGLDLCYPCDLLSDGPYVTIENSKQCDGTESPRFLSTHLSSFSCFTGSIIRSTPEECARCGELRRYDTSLGACIRK